MLEFREDCRPKFPRDMVDLKLASPQIPRTRHEANRHMTFGLSIVRHHD